MEETTQAPAKIADLAAAFAAAQGELTNPPKTKTVSTTKYKYSFAPLPEILDAVRPVLAKHQLCIVQIVEGSQLTTRLIHATGQYISGSYTLPPLHADPQGMGSAITYARRYSLCSMLGIAGDDDEDALAAQAGMEAKETAEREAAEEELRKAKANAKKGAPNENCVSAYDGRKLEKGETPLPKEESKSEVDVSGVAPSLGALMLKAGLTKEQLRAFYVAKGHFKDTMEPEKLPADYVTGLVKNWDKVLAGVKGGAK